MCCNINFTSSKITITSAITRLQSKSTNIHWSWIAHVPSLKHSKSAPCFCRNRCPGTFSCHHIATVYVCYKNTWFYTRYSRDFKKYNEYPCLWALPITVNFLFPFFFFGINQEDVSVYTWHCKHQNLKEFIATVHLKFVTTPAGPWSQDPGAVGRVGCRCSAGLGLMLCFFMYEMNCSGISASTSFARTAWLRVKSAPYCPPMKSRNGTNCGWKNTTCTYKKIPRVLKIALEQYQPVVMIFLKSKEFNLII